MSNIDVAYYIKLPFEIAYLLLFFVYSFVHLAFRKIIPRSPKFLDNEVILITGCSKGIGKEMALYLAKYHSSSKLVLWDVDKPGNMQTAEVVKKFGISVHPYTVDISDRIAVEKAALQVVREVGEVTIVINNAGIAGYGSILEQSPELIEKTFQINLIGHFWVLRAFLPSMIRRNYGHVVTFCSLASYAALRNATAYAASKYGVRGFIRSLQSDIRADPHPTDNIKFTTVYPYFVNTTMSDRVKLRSKIGPLNAFLDPADVAKEVIEGVRRNEDKIIIPGFLELPLILSNLCPESFLYKLEDWLAQDSDFVNEK